MAHEFGNEKKKVHVMKREKKNVQRIDHNGKAQETSDNVEHPVIYMGADEVIGIILSFAMSGRSSRVYIGRGFSEGV